MMGPVGTYTDVNVCALYQLVSTLYRIHLPAAAVFATSDAESMSRDWPQL